MLRIRLRRVGKKGKPSYRIVVAESSAPRDGAYVEWIGNYDPLTDPPSYSIKADRAQEWISQGAQPTDAVQRILDWSATAVADGEEGDQSDAYQEGLETEETVDAAIPADDESAASEGESSTT